MAVVGTPGSGKTHFSRELSKQLNKSQIINLNSIVEKYKLYSKQDKFGTKIVKLRDLQRIVKSEIEKKNGIIILDGHLGVELKLFIDIVVVIRINLKILEHRLKSRGYPTEKIGENLISEATDYSGSKAENTYNEVYQISNSKSKDKIVEYIINKSKGINANQPSVPTINRLHELIYFINKGNPYNF